GISRFVLVPFLATPAAGTPGLWANPPSGVDMPPLGIPGLLIPTDELARLYTSRDSNVSVIDARNDYTLYLAGHIPRAVYLNVEELRAADLGVPNKVLGLPSYTALFSRLGITADRPVVIYSAGETRDNDATYLAWILEGLGHPSVALLDGGFGKWTAENRPVTRRYPATVPTPFAPPSYAARGITPDKTVIAYCNGGLESSHVYFALHTLLGFPRVRVYDGSFTEWSEKVELPVTTGDQP